MARKKGYTPPRPRKHINLWQAYQWWCQLNEISRKYKQRMKAIEAGKTTMDPVLETDLYETAEIKESLAMAKKVMIDYGKELGPVWEWVTSIKGLGAGGLAAKLLARIDDIGRFETISKLWRYAGYAVINGEIDRPRSRETRPYDARLKSVCWEIGEQFIRQRTPVYRDRYDEYKEEDRREHPNVRCLNCGTEFPPTRDSCPKCKQTNEKYSLMYCRAHMNSRARRAAVKLFLSHLWVNWRKMEGLPITDPYVDDILGHTNIIPPPDLPDEDD